ncbi:MAG: YraN family protein [Myxococcota bacterium]
MGDRREAYEHGLDAESFVEAYLRDEGWQTLARNWRGGGAELDLVVRRDGAVRVVEVKAREDGRDALESVTPDKQARLRRGAEAWLASAGEPESEIAFMVAVVTLNDGVWGLELWDDAF